MTPDEFRHYGHEAVDWIAGYLENPGRYPVFPKVEPGELIDALPKCAPEKGEPVEKLLEDFRSLVVPGMTHWNHPGFMAYFAITGSGPGILGEMLSAALNVNGMLWRTSPAATELEQVALGWLRQWIGLPDNFFGIIYDTASISSMHAIAAARELAEPEARVRGGTGNLTLYTSEQAHSSIEKGAIAIGIGQRNVRKIPVDEAFRMRVDLLEEAIEKDLAAGLRPFCVAATVGTTSTTSVDPLDPIADLTERHNLWLHVDAAYGGGAAILPEFQHILAGARRADSVVTNPHKWLFTPADLSAFFTRRPDILRRAFSLIPEYLRTPDQPRAVNFMDYGVQLGRRFRALKLWFVMRYFGREGVSELIRKHIGWAQELASWIDADARFERSAPAPFSVVCFRLKGSDDDNRRLLDRVNASGEVFLSHTALHGRFVLRLAIGNIATTHAHVERAWELVRQAV
ncbi:MAG: amino acid decarboxylase [Bryobacterales bacterium]|nr:amino acid decarboxylase [Bryobacterales bacterium]